MDALPAEGPILLAAGALFVAMAAAWELAARLRRRAVREGANPGSESEGGQVLAAVTGLLALLVAFTFGLALDRFEARREIVVVEANALGTAYLRTSLLDEPLPLRGLIRAYTRERLTYGLAEGRAKAAAAGRAARLQAAVWAEANAQVRPYRATPIAVLLLTPLNEAFDSASASAAVLAARIPMTVLVILWLYAIMAAGVLGYVIGDRPRPHRSASFMLFVLLALAMALILDLDQPRSGSIRVPQGPLAAALAAMN